MTNEVIQFAHKTIKELEIVLATEEARLEQAAAAAENQADLIPDDDNDAVEASRKHRRELTEQIMVIDSLRDGLERTIHVAECVQQRSGAMTERGAARSSYNRAGPTSRGGAIIDDRRRFVRGVPTQDGGVTLPFGGHTRTQNGAHSEPPRDSQSMSINQKPTNWHDR